MSSLRIIQPNTTHAYTSLLGIIHDGEEKTFSSEGFTILEHTESGGAEWKIADGV